MLLGGLLGAAISPAGAMEKPQPFAVPGAAYLHGIGPITGGAIGAKRLFTQDDAYIAAIKTFGEVRAGGVILNGISFFDKKLTAGASYGVLEEADFKTSYGRGFGEDLVVRQVMKGNGGGLKIGFHPLPERISLFAGYSYSVLRFVGYKTRSGETIPFRMDDLHDVNATMMSFGVIAHLLPPTENNPHHLTIHGKYSTLEGRIGQSDLKLIDLRIKGREQLSKRWSIAYTTQLQRAIVSNPAGSAAVDGNCSTVADADLRQKCTILERGITDFIFQSNRVGTVLPLGGSRGLRSYRELRFKAANTALSGLEVQWQIHPRYPAHLIAFYELGYAADKLSTLYANSRYSAGLGARFLYREMPIRAEIAAGPEGRAGFLTLGLPW